MKKILILSYYYPPANFVGAERIASFALHLHTYGYYPIVVTRNWNPHQTTTYERVQDNGCKHNVFPTHEEYYLPYHRSLRDRLFDSRFVFAVLLRRMLTFLELVLSGVTIHALPYANLYSQARKILREQNDIEALIISGSPFESFHFGYLLKKEFPQLHWIPGYRDEWTAFRRYPSTGYIEHLIFRFQTYLEKKYTSNASAFMSVADYWVEKIEQHIQKPGFKVMNGFEPREAIQSVHVSLNPHILKIAYAGSIYPNQDFAPLIALLTSLHKNYQAQLTIQLEFFGVAQDSEQAQQIDSLCKRQEIHLHFHKRIPQKELNQKLLSCDLLYVSKYGNFNNFIPVKVFDYYNFGIPVLHYPSDEGEIEKFILSTNIGISSSKGAEVYAALVEIVENKLSNQDVRNRERFQKRPAPFYTRQHQASVLAQELDRITYKSSPPIPTELKTVLILAYDFPPYVSVGGLRPFHWYKHFKEYGLFPIVVTRQWENKYGNSIDYISKSRFDFTICEGDENGLIYRTAYKPNLANRMVLLYGEDTLAFLRRFVTLLYEICQFILPLGSKRELYKEARKVLQNHKIDFILATGEPFVLFHYAEALSQEYKIPWAGDYRDPWAMGTVHYLPYVLYRWYAWHEKRLVQKMNMAFTVSEYMRTKIQNFTANALPVHVVSNGFDGDAIQQLEKSNVKNECLTFSYAGWIYPYHPYRLFLKVLSEFKIENPDFQFEFTLYGVNLQKELERLLYNEFPNLNEHFHFYPKIPNAQLLANLSKADVLILFNEYAFMGTKIYDYLGVNTFILHLFTEEKEAMELKEKYFPMQEEELLSNRLQEEVLHYTKAGVSIKNKEELKTTLKHLWDRFKQEGCIQMQAEHRDEFSRKSQTKKMAEIILKTTCN